MFLRRPAKLGDACVDAIVLACTSASVVRGPAYDAQLTAPGTPAQHLGRVSPAELAAEVVGQVGAGADAVLVSCANARLFAAVPRLC